MPELPNRGSQNETSRGNHQIPAHLYHAEWANAWRPKVSAFARWRSDHLTTRGMVHSKAGRTIGRPPCWQPPNKHRRAIIDPYRGFFPPASFQSDHDPTRGARHYQSGRMSLALGRSTVCRPRLKEAKTGATVATVSARLLASIMTISAGLPISMP